MTGFLSEPPIVGHIERGIVDKECVHICGETAEVVSQTTSLKGCKHNVHVIDIWFTNGWLRITGRAEYSFQV